MPYDRISFRETASKGRTGRSKRMTDKALSPLDLLDQMEGSRLVANIMHFGRILRTAGLPIGTGKILDGVNAIRAVGIGKRTDFYWALHAVFVNRRDQHEMFDQPYQILHPPDWKNFRISSVPKAPGV